MIKDIGMLFVEVNVIKRMLALDAYDFLDIIDYTVTAQTQALNMFGVVKKLIPCLLRFASMC